MPRDEVCSGANFFTWIDPNFWIGNHDFENILGFRLPRFQRVGDTDLTTLFQISAEMITLVNSMTSFVRDWQIVIIKIRVSMTCIQYFETWFYP